MTDYAALVARLREKCWFDAAAAIEAQAAELALRRKSGSASDRLHNLCEGIARDADGSEWSREEWQRVDAETVRLANELRDAKAELARVTAERDAAVTDARLAAFGAWAAHEFRAELGDVDGGSAQYAMQRCGVLVAVEVTEPCGEDCRCAEYGDWPMQCYRYAPGIADAIAARQPTAQEPKG